MEPVAWGRRRLDRGTPRGRPLTGAAAAGGLWAADVLVILVVGSSRIYLGAHWLTDVLGGYALGAWLVALVVIVRLSAGTAMVGSESSPAREIDG
jgi:membrane-associated phospholipid phosphatase